MREMGIRAQWTKPWTTTTRDPDFSKELRNVLNEKFNPERPNAVWCTDITYIWTQNGFVYLNCVMDLYARKIIAWTLADTMEVSTVIETINKAKACRNTDFCRCIFTHHKKNKYELIRCRIIALFKENKERYGYRRIHALLKRENVIISEKIVRRIMKEEQLLVKIKKTRKYNSYQGEISPAVDNIVNRDFSAMKPNEKWLTDITEFAIPAGKIYLSPIVDCFDGLIVTWNIGTSSDAALVNTMLDNAIHTLKSGEKPIVHSDRGVHYRWPGWINLMECNGLIRSMSMKGCSPDNSACEGFFGR